MPPLAFGSSKAAIERPAKPQRGAAAAFAFLRSPAEGGSRPFNPDLSEPSGLGRRLAQP